MTNKMNLWSALRTSTWEHRRSAGKWLAYTVGCGFLPIIFGLLLVWGFSQQFKFYDFVIHGEFAIYSATLIAGSARLISKDTETFPFVHREMFILVVILTLVLAVALYVLIKTAILLNAQNTVNNSVIVHFSVPLLIFSLVFSFVVFLLDQQRITPNIRGIAKLQQDKLAADFDNLQNSNDAK
jgi:hypothetical protein